MKHSTENRFALARQKCEPCEGGASALLDQEIREMASQQHGGWMVVENHHLSNSYKFQDFRQALEFTNRVGELAEAEGHHPEICVGWGRVKIDIWTHAVDGLTKNDFILAAKISEVVRK